MILQVGVKILLENKDGKFLLIRRNPKKYPEVGPVWDIVGGRINPGTELLENLSREVMEETGLTILGEVKLIAAQDIFVKNKETGELDKHVVRLTYLGKADGQVKIDEESLEYNWFSKQQLSEIEDSQLDKYFKQVLVSVV